MEKLIREKRNTNFSYGLLPWSLDPGTLTRMGWTGLWILLVPWSIQAPVWLQSSCFSAPVTTDFTLGGFRFRCPARLGSVLPVLEQLDLLLRKKPAVVQMPRPSLVTVGDLVEEVPAIDLRLWGQSQKVAGRESGGSPMEDERTWRWFICRPGLSSCSQMK